MIIHLIVGLMKKYCYIKMGNFQSFHSKKESKS